MEHRIIERGQLKAWLDDKKNFVLVNVLSKESFDEEHLPGSVHADVAEENFLERIGEFAPDKNTPIVVYCHAGNTSPPAAQKLTDAGYLEVYDYKGGMEDWKDAGYSLEGSGLNR